MYKFIILCSLVGLGGCMSEIDVCQERVSDPDCKIECYNVSDDGTVDYSVPTTSRICDGHLSCICLSPGQ